MTAFIYHEVSCDGPGDVLGSCGKAYSDAGTATQVRQRAKEAGWAVSRPGGKDYCPGHRTVTTGS